MLDFDLVLGMDWLTPHHVVFDCYAKTVTLMIPRMPQVVWQGSMSWASTGIISYVQAKRLNSIGCSVYLPYVGDVSAETLTEEFVAIEYEFPDEFPADLAGLSPEWEVNFTTEVELIIKPISIPLYLMAQIKLKELGTQLQSLLDLGFIWLSISPWGALSYL